MDGCRYRIDTVPVGIRGYKTLCSNCPNLPACRPDAKGEDDMGGTKCKACNEKNVVKKGLCSGCYKDAHGESPYTEKQREKGFTNAGGATL